MSSDESEDAGINNNGVAINEFGFGREDTDEQPVSSCVNAKHPREVSFRFNMVSGNSGEQLAFDKRSGS